LIMRGHSAVQNICALKRSQARGLRNFLLTRVTAACEAPAQVRVREATSRWLMSPLRLPRQSQIFARVITASLFLALIGVNVLLQMRAHALAMRVAYLEQIRGPVAGAPLTDLTGTDLDGHPKIVSFANLDSPSLALVYSPSCPYCERNLLQWKELIAAVGKAHIVLIDASGQMNRADVDHLNLLNLPGTATLIRLSNTSRLENNLLLTPATIAVASNGIVRYTALGILDRRSLLALHRSIAQP
jgi:hypothetical protein